MRFENYGETERIGRDSKFPLLSAIQQTHFSSHPVKKSPWYKYYLNFHEHKLHMKSLSLPYPRVFEYLSLTSVEASKSQEKQWNT